MSDKKSPPALSVLEGGEEKREQGGEDRRTQLGEPHLSYFQAMRTQLDVAQAQAQARVDQAMVAFQTVANTVKAAAGVPAGATIDLDGYLTYPLTEPTPKPALPAGETPPPDSFPLTEGKKGTQSGA
jgi:hypothetical protein